MTVKERAIQILKRSGVRNVIGKRNNRLTLTARKQWYKLVDMAMSALLLSEDVVATSDCFLKKIEKAYCEDIFQIPCLITQYRHRGIYDILEVLVNNPTLKVPKKVYDSEDYFHYCECSKKGFWAYDILVDMIYLLDDICPEVNVNNIVDVLDQLI